MGLKLNITTTSLMLLLASAVEVSCDTIFDVTKYGAKADENINISQNLRFNFITNSMVKDITSRYSKRFHINLLGCKNSTFYNVAISALEESLNTDGIHIGRSSGINITDSTIETGDDCVSIGADSEQINIQRVTYGPGHGISVGSLGKYPHEEPVVGISVKNCTSPTPRMA
ncbi:hypothetical protein VitviT2T_018079 [Vitis vinifera]|uniref:Exopolygalacturonase n=1 Tax=Vitis vinifera TaxID=29760 RepID=A0ABY9CYR1_VITVI|nr:hypothetical protein VitviT2T_018079 [Vitis vinifera]